MSDDLERVYAGYVGSDAVQERWSGANPGNRAIHTERNEALGHHLRAALAEAGGARARRPVVLEVGCGEGVLLGELRDLARGVDAAFVGLDLLLFRLRTGRDAGADVPLVNGDGTALPFADSGVDVVVLATVLSSITDDSARGRLAGEVRRVLAPGGSILWYDMRAPNPFNAALRAVPRRQLRALFPGAATELTSITLLPQLARRLGGATARAYPRLARIPLLRTHVLGRIRPPSS